MSTSSSGSPGTYQRSERKTDQATPDQVTADQVLTWAPQQLLKLGRRWRRLTARTRRVVWVSVVVPTVIALSALPAYADGVTAPSALSWIDVKDSHGISIWQYEMSLDRGGVSHPVRSVWAIFVDLLWQIYRGFVAFACWLVDWTLSMDWLGWLTKPVIGLGDNLHQMVDRFGATAALLTLTAMVAVLWMAKGRWTLGIFELFMSLFIASLAVGILANPVRIVAGDDGMLINSRDAAMSIAAGLQSGDSTNTSSDALRQQSTAMLAETFLRKPQQLINFGVVIDDTNCEKPYDEALKNGPYGDESDLRDAVSNCEEALGEVAENPNAGMVMSLAALMPAGFIAVLFTAVLCGVVLIAGVYALYQSLKMIVALVLALLPNGARGSLWMTFAELIISMVTIIFSIVFLAAYLMLIQSVFATGQSPMATFFVVDVLLMVGIVVFWKGRQRIKASAEKLAQAMSKRPGGAGPSSLPARSRMNPADLYYKGRMAAQGARAAGAGARLAGQGVRAAGGPAARAAYGPVDRALGRLAFAGAAAGTAGATTAGGHGGPGADHPAERLQQRLAGPGTRRGQLTSGRAKIAIAAVSGGTVPALATAGKVATVALNAGPRRVALQGRLQPAPVTSPQPRPKRPAAVAAHGTGRRPVPGAGGPATTQSTTEPRVVLGQVVTAPKTSSRSGTSPQPRPLVGMSSSSTSSASSSTAKPPSSSRAVPAVPSTAPAKSTSSARAAARPLSTSAAEQELRTRLAARQRRPIALGTPPRRTHT